MLEAKKEVLERVFGVKCITKGCVIVRNAEWVHVERFRMYVLVQTRQAKSRSLMRVEGFGACFWAKRSTKSRDACGKIEVLDCIGMCVLGQAS